MKSFMTINRLIKVLLIEEDKKDFELLDALFGRIQNNVGINIRRADRLSSALEMLENGSFEAVLTDLSLPDSRGLDTVAAIRERFPDIPLIILTDMADRGLALEAIRMGAQDYVAKSHINNRALLLRIIIYSIERQKLLVELERRMNEIKTLRGIIPICAWCRKIRDDDGYWKKVEEYVREHTDAEFSHGICEECAGKTLSELDGLK